MSTPLKVWQRWSTPTKATNPDSNGKVSGMVSEIQYEDDPRRLPDRVSELEKEVCFYCDLLCFVRYFFLSLLGFSLPFLIFIFSSPLISVTVGY